MARAWLTNLPVWVPPLGELARWIDADRADLESRTQSVAAVIRCRAG
jgi:hypothetical protein